MLHEYFQIWQCFSMAVLNYWMVKMPTNKNSIYIFKNHKLSKAKNVKAVER
jgi:hypothetical protein